MNKNHKYMRKLWIIIVAGILSASISYFTLWSHSRGLFKKWVIDPIPESVTLIRADRHLFEINGRSFW